MEGIGYIYILYLLIYKGLKPQRTLLYSLGKHGAVSAKSLKVSFTRGFRLCDCPQPGYCLPIQGEARSTRWMPIPSQAFCYLAEKNEFQTDPNKQF